MARKKQSPWRRTTDAHGPYLPSLGGHCNKPSGRHQPPDRSAANRAGWALAQGFYPLFRDALLAGVPAALLQDTVMAAIGQAAGGGHGRQA